VTSGAPIRVMIVDDHPVVREGLVAIIGREPDMRVVAEAEDGERAAALFSEHLPDVTLMDLRLPGMSGVEAITEILRGHAKARFLVLTTYDGEEDIFRALRAGARGYLLKDMFREELLSAIRAVHSGTRWIPPAIAERLAERLPGPDLSSRELEVLTLIVRGMSNKEIGAALRITEGTVKGHVNNVLGKLGVTDRTQAAIGAIQRGIVRP
jgi:two-component system, NarL family, response regulator